MDLEKVEAILEGKETRPFNVMEALQDIQAEFCYLPEEAIYNTVRQTMATDAILHTSISLLYSPPKIQGEFHGTNCM
jgi:hypothetical protein